MKFSIAAAVAAMSFACAGSALAAPPVTAKLLTPVSAPVKLVAGGAVFFCNGDTCVAAAPSSRTLSSAACKEISKEVGAVSTFGDGRKQLDGDKLDRCNAGLPVGTQVANR